jgi:hypothetical protein
MTATRQLVAALLPLVDRMHRGHCWRKDKAGNMTCIKEPLDDFKLAQHCAGREAYGLCPIAPGTNTTRVALLDFDSHKGEVPFDEMVRLAREVMDTAALVGLDGVAFRSSGGRGIHVYFLFDHPQDAHSVRETLRGVLAGCGLADGTAGVAAGTAEIFPKQLEVGPDGFGSMFVLALAGESVLLDDAGAPLPRDAILQLEWPMSESVPFVEAAPKAERILTTTSPDIARLRSALASIPNDPGNSLSYEKWRDLGFSVHYATQGSGEGLEVFREFSARSPKHDDDFLENNFWHYAGRTSGEVITERTLFNMAGAQDWQDSTIADDFDIVEAPEEDEEKAGLPMFTPVRAAEFAADRPMGWIIKHVLPRSDLGMVFGASGSGKSFLLIDMACSIVRGVPWRGKKVQRGRVCYVVAEGSAGFRKRLDAYCIHHKIDIAEMDLYIIADAPNLNEKAHVKALINGIRSAGQFDLIVLDTLAAVSAGADENSAKEMGVILERARAVGKAAGAMTLLVHHSGKDAGKGARGSTAIKGRVDVEIEVIRCDNGREASVSKLRDQEDGAAFGFKLLTIPLSMDDEGEVIDSCVVEHSDEPVVRDKKAKGAVQRMVLDAVRDMYDLGGVMPLQAEAEEKVLEKAIANDHGPERWDAKRRHNKLGAIRSAIDNMVTKEMLIRDDGRVGLWGV